MTTTAVARVKKQPSLPLEITPDPQSIYTALQTSFDELLDFQNDISGCIPDMDLYERLETAILNQRYVLANLLQEDLNFTDDYLEYVLVAIESGYLKIRKLITKEMELIKEKI